ncbi:hypothetical protein Ancab_037264 [Ancistrocladus abbreviatus]
MANLRTAMDAAFWDLNIASPQNLDGCAKAVPGEPFPLDGARASRALRVQQLSLLGNGFPLGIIPSLCASPHKELGSFSLQSLLLRTSISDWWLGLVGQFRPKKLVSSLKAEFSFGDEWELPSFKDVARHFLDKSLYSIGLFSHIPLTSSSSVLLSSEAHGERKGRYKKFMFFQKLPYHDVTVEAAWPELFIDSKGRYWQIPESISLDLASLAVDSGLRYRFGIHKNSGHPQGVYAGYTDDPSTFIMPGLFVKAAFSYEKSRDLWRQKETNEDLIIKTDKGHFWRPAYDVRLKEPHATVSAIIGGACGAWFRGDNNMLNLKSRDDGEGISKKRSSLSADLFGSVCYTFQHGKFRKPYGDLTRVDAHLDVCSASSFIKSISSICRPSSYTRKENHLSCPRLRVTFQQQVAGPIVFRVDTKCMVNSPTRGGLEIEDFIYSLSYSLRLLRSGKVVAWYSPKRKEGMIELRVFEF